MGTLLFYVVIATVCSILPSFEANYGYVEKYYDQKLDHFNFASHGNATYKQRYLYNDTWWDKGHGPIFFYAGNEGDVLSFYQNSGFVFNAAKHFNALVVFAEHRYYGKSLPFGSDSFSRENISLLSIEQVMADFAFFLKDFKKMYSAEESPVIAFGGSYGGMLAAYMRFKFPNIIQGAIAASAPLIDAAGLLPGDIFFEAVTKAFRNISTQCEGQVRSAFSQVDKWASLGESGLAQVSRTFRLCDPLKTSQDYDHFLRWIRNAFLMVAMGNYPYPASFMGNFPAFPVKVMCGLLTSASRPADGLSAAVSLFYNDSQTLPCFDIYQEYFYCADPTGCIGSKTDGLAWDYQACTEIDFKASTDGVKDMFPVLPFDSSMRDAYCQKTWNITPPRTNWIDVMFWGKDIGSSSNIVFSNGNLDPCAPGGILNNISDTLVSVLIDGGAHHLDLRDDNPNDPPSVRQARQFEIQNISKWLADFYAKKKREKNHSY